MCGRIWNHCFEPFRRRQVYQQLLLGQVKAVHGSFHLDRDVLFQPGTDFLPEVFLFLRVLILKVHEAPFRMLAEVLG